MGADRISKKWFDAAVKKYSYNSTTGEVTIRETGEVSKTIQKGRNYYYELSVSITGVQKKVKTHRFAWYIMHGEMPSCLDHINRDSLDNRLCNLRPVTFSQNSMNRKKQNNNKTGTTGVYKRSYGVHRAYIRYETKLIHLGQGTFEECVALRKAAELKYFGEYAPA